MKKWLIVPALFLLTSCGFNGETVFYSKYLLKNKTVDNVKIGDVISVESKTLVYEGNSQTVGGQIILPDGTSKAGNKFTIEMPGVYTVKYSAIFGVHEETVYIYYHCHRSSGDFFISSNANNPALTGEYSHPVKNGTIKGAILKLDSKTTFTYDKEIDFSSYDFNDSFIDFVIDTSKQATSDIETFTVRLTDVEDNNNYVDITVTDSGPTDDDGKGCYMLAGSNSQFKTGFEGGREGRFHISKYGANVGMSFRDLPDKGAQVASLYFDYENRALYASPMYNAFGDARKNIITDLDDKEIYGSTIWEGFKNGKAKVSIFANSLYSNNGTLVVSKIANLDLSPLDFVDNDSPTIKIDYKGQSSITVPKATVGKPYKIYDAEIIDNYDNNLSYTTYVTFLDEINGKTKDITVDNGYFTPTQPGKYTITYLTKDHSNNEATKTVDVVATTDSQKMTIDLDVKTINSQLYSPVILPSIDYVKGLVKGGSGKPHIERYVVDKNCNLIKTDGDSFIPKEVGTYKVYYQATDYIDNITTAVVTVSVADPGKPVFIENIVLPRILIKGHKYTLPSYQGAEVVDNKTVYLTSRVYVNEKLLENNSFIAEETCVIKYQLNGARGITDNSNPVTVVNAGEPLDLNKYFSGNLNSELNKDNITLSAETGVAESLFASVLPYSNLYLKFALDKSLFHADELVFKYSDSTNANNSLSFHIKVRGGNTYISIGESSQEYLFNSFVEGENETYVIDFSTDTNTLKDVLHKEVEIVKYNDQGEPFVGFNGGVYLDISLKNVTSHSEFKLLTISNQPLGILDMNPYTDFADPIILLRKEFLNEQEYMKNAYIPAVEVFDVLSNANATVSVKAPDGTYKLNNVDATKDNTFVLDQFGNYIVTYKGIDDEGNSVTSSRKIIVYDYQAPELKITGSLKETYKLNDAISIPSYTVNDNLNDYTLDVILILPDNQERLLLIDRNGEITSYLIKDNMYYNSSFKVDSNTFRAEQRGRYILRYIAYDSYFNKTAMELTFEVK